ncbi:hypothetical protein HMPREF1557_00959 [Streptococcus sobrinus W1703]|uniref:Uncharacterized protein n=1 Tax=Streptococcus sobrinus W1703 TaxID=1227275 RepID=U2J8W4_9STRE|nr:hypothetical protein HMPREF1557_00959 [Streptococcus sobrinus W1703]
MENEVDNGNGYNTNDVGSKAWSIIVEILTGIVVLEEGAGSIIWNPCSKSRGVA